MTLGARTSGRKFESCECAVTPVTSSLESSDVLACNQQGPVVSKAFSLNGGEAENIKYVCALHEKSAQYF